MNNRRDFDPLAGAPTMAAPAAGQQQAAWPQQAPYGGSGPYPPYGQQPPDMYDEQQASVYGQQLPAAEAPARLPVYRRPGVVFGAAAVAAVIAVGALLATWVSKDSVGTTPANTTGTPSQQVQVPLAPAQPSAPPPSQSVVVPQPAPRQQAPQYVPRQQAPAPRVVPNNPSAVSPAPVSPAPVSPQPNPNENPNPEGQNPAGQNPQNPEGQNPQNPAGTNPGGTNPAGTNPGSKFPANETPEDTLCHPLPPPC